MPKFDQYSDVIDSRDVIARIEELRDEIAGADTITEKDELRGQLDPIENLAEQGENATEGWPYGATLIRDSYFREYAIELAHETDSELLDTVRNRGYSIDWDMYARDLQTEYTSVEYLGVTYWVH